MLHYMHGYLSDIILEEILVAFLDSLEGVD
jgi:hypothetical protein